MIGFNDLLCRDRIHSPWLVWAVRWGCCEGGAGPWPLQDSPGGSWWMEWWDGWGENGECVTYSVVGAWLASSPGFPSDKKAWGLVYLSTCSPRSHPWSWSIKSWNCCKLLLLWALHVHTLVMLQNDPVTNKYGLVWSSFIAVHRSSGCGQLGAGQRGCCRSLLQQ